MWGADAGFRESVCLFGQRANVPCHPVLGAQHSFNQPWKPKFSLELGGTVIYLFFFGLNCFYMVTLTTPFCLGDIFHIFFY